MIKTKLCGFTTEETLKCAVESGADFVGFVFYLNSSRNISPKNSAKICQNALPLKSKVKKVAVIVDAHNQEIDEIVHHLKPDFLQIHNSNMNRIAEIKKKFQVPIIKAFSINKEQDLEVIKNYEEIADLFLFDTETQEFGGSGKAFDWKILKNLSTKKDWFLSGGLNVDNIEKALKISGAKMIDLSSGIEEKKGVKSTELIKEFMIKTQHLPI